MKKSQRGPIFSPKGIPIGNRQYRRIPIVEPSPDDAGDLRRSRRSKHKPLEYWRNERVEYGPAEDDAFVEEIGDMPLPKAIMRAQDTPYRKRKVTEKSKTTQNKSKKGQGTTPSTSTDDDGDDVVFDYSKLKKKYKGNLIESETANVWDDGVDELNDLSTCRVMTV
jgi:centromere protein C